MSLKKDAALGICTAAALVTAGAQPHTVPVRFTATVLPACRFSVEKGGTDPKAAALPQVNARCNLRDSAPPPRQVLETATTPDTRSPLRETSDAAAPGMPLMPTQNATVLTLYY